MIAAVEWSELQVASAFVLGAILATIGVLRVVRSVSSMFAELEDRRRRTPRRRDTGEGD